jgi:hypothetical protein
VEEAVAAPNPKRAEPLPRLLDWVGSDPVALRRLGVYAHAYFERLLETFGADYPATAKLLGETDFRRLAANYLEANPSTTYHIDEVGAGIPLFLEAHPLTAVNPWLPDLARLEAAVFACAYADRAPATDPTALNGLTPDQWPGIRFSLNGVVTLLKVEWDVAAPWSAVRRGEEEIPLPEKKPQRLLVTRREGWPEVEALPSPAWETLRLLGEGLPLGEVCAQAAERFAEEGLDFQTWFARWTAEGVIIPQLPPRGEGWAVGQVVLDPQMGVPVESKALKGPDSLLSIAQTRWRASPWGP